MNPVMPLLRLYRVYLKKVLVRKVINYGIFPLTRCFEIVVDLFPTVPFQSQDDMATGQVSSGYGLPQCGFVSHRNEKGVASHKTPGAKEGKQTTRASQRELIEQPLCRLLPLKSGRVTCYIFLPMLRKQQFGEGWGGGMELKMIAAPLVSIACSDQV